MKKTLSFVAAALVATLLLSSCGKRCWCYEAVGSHMTESEVYTDEANRCNNLSTQYRTCVEDGERMDIDQIAFK